MLNTQEVEELSKSFFTNLKIMNLFKKTDFHVRYGNQIIRNHYQLNNITRREEIFKHHLENYLKWNNENLPHMPMKKFDYFIEFTTLFTNHGLATYESLKRFFLETLDLELINKKIAKKPNDFLIPTSMWGNIARAIGKLPCVDPRVISDLFDVEFRNSLAHDSWYFENNFFKYLDMKRNIVELPLIDLPLKIRAIFGFYTFVTKEYFKEYYPEIIENDEINQKKYGLLPIFELTPDDKSTSQK